MVRTLLDAGADVNNSNSTAAGADTRPTNALGRDAFLLAAAGGQPQTIDMFLARGADVNAVDKRRNSQASDRGRCRCQCER